MIEQWLKEYAQKREPPERPKTGPERPAFQKEASGSR
jgi:hypothetical protein